MHAKRITGLSILLGLMGLALIMFMGCEEQDDDSAADDDDATEVAELKSTYPQEGAADFYHRNSVLIEFTDEATGAEIALVDGSGAAITGDNTMNDNGTKLTFNPFGDSDTDHLDPTTSYTATISWPDHAAVDLHFQTSDVGTPVESEDAILGQDYFLDLSTAQFTQPPGVGNLLAQYLTEVYVIMHMKAIEGSECEVYGGIVDIVEGDYVQDLCDPTLAMTDEDPGLWDDPYMQIGPTDFFIAIEGYEATIEGLRIGGSFTSDGSMLVGGTFDGQMDTRVLDSLIDPNAEEGAACELLTSLGIECEECPGDGAMFCLTVSAFDIVAEQVDIAASHLDHPESGITYDTLTEVSEEQIDEWEGEGFCDPETEE